MHWIIQKSLYPSCKLKGWEFSLKNEKAETDFENPMRCQFHQHFRSSFLHYILFPKLQAVNVIYEKADFDMVMELKPRQVSILLQHSTPSFYERWSQKHTKGSQVISLFAFLGSARVTAACRTLRNLTPGRQIIQTRKPI